MELGSNICSLGPSANSEIFRSKFETIPSIHTRQELTSLVADEMLNLTTLHDFKSHSILQYVLLGAGLPTCLQSFVI